MTNYVEAVEIKICSTSYLMKTNKGRLVKVLMETCLNTELMRMTVKKMVP